MRRHRVSSSSRRGREDAPRPVQTSVPTATDMFEQIVQDKPACFGNEPLSLRVRTISYMYVRACTNMPVAAVPHSLARFSFSFVRAAERKPRPRLFEARAFSYGAIAMKTGFRTVCRLLTGVQIVSIAVSIPLIDLNRQ